MEEISRIKYRAKIEKHLKILVRDVDLLEGLLKEHNYDARLLASSPYTLMATERLLERIINNMIDIAFMVVKYAKLADLSSPKTYRQGLEILCDKKVLSKNLCKSLQGLVGVRNILVHEYVEFQLQKIEGELRAKIQDFYEFAKQVRNFLDTIES